MDDTAASELRTYVLDLVYVLFQDDTALGIDDRLPTPPTIVTGVKPHPHQWDADRIDGFNLDGTFSTSKVMTLDWGGGKFEDRYDIVTAYVTPNNLPEHLGARLTMSGQPGMTVSQLSVRAETLKNPPAPPPSLAPKATLATTAPPAAPTSPPTPTSPSPVSDEPLKAVIGSIEPLPEFDLTGLVGERTQRQLEAFRSFEAFDQISVFMAADPGRLYFGMPPAFAPIIRLGTDGMTIGLMIDAPELGFIDTKGCLYEFSSLGLTLTDARVDPMLTIWRSVTQRRIHLEESGDQEVLERWRETADEFKEAMGWDDFSRVGIPGFAWGDKRRKPLGAPRGSKWRTDASGNGVLAMTEQWGDVAVRRPRNVAAALRVASELAPAAALHTLREGLVHANHTNDATAAGQVYRAMVDPLEQLGRLTTAARADAFGALAT